MQPNDPNENLSPASPLADESPAFQPPPPGQVITGGSGAPVAPAPPPNPTPPLGESPAGGMPPAPAAPNQPAQPPMFASDQPPAAALPKKRSFKLPLIILAILMILAGGAAAAYFGYYMNASVILSQSLSNTGKGYDQIVSYMDQQSKVSYKGSTTTGSFKLKDGGTSTDGNISIKTNGANSDTNFDIGLGVTRAKVEVRTVEASKDTTPDIYFKASGIQGVGTLLGSPALDKSLSQLDNQWVAVDHTLIDNLSAATTQSKSASLSPPTETQVVDELQAFGKVNKQYVFTTDKNKSVAKVVKKYGTESIDGRKLYHYKMALDKAHVKQYVTAQRDALNASQLGSWLKKNDYDKTVNDSYNSLEKSADGISDNNTFDLWADVNSRLVYKVRMNGKSNPAANYVDVGLNYKNSSSYPFFINYQNKDGKNTDTGSIMVTLNRNGNNVVFKANLQSSGSSPSSLSANLTYQPTNNVSKITAPDKTVPVIQVLNQLGLGDLLTAAAAGSQNSPLTTTGQSAGTSAPTQQ